MCHNCTAPCTAEDKGILDEKGNLVEDDQDIVLENILAVRCCRYHSAQCACAGFSPLACSYRWVDSTTSHPLFLSPSSRPLPQREDKERAKARRAAGKQAKPLWEEDGKRRGLLDKYDEEEEQGMQVGNGGGGRGLVVAFVAG